MSTISPCHLHGLVDMGSNGIRFSITNLAPEIARSLPVVFHERLGISLYEAQYSTGIQAPIPQDVIDAVLIGLKRFKAVCADFDVSEENITVLATEATRGAMNSEDFRSQIKKATGWNVKLLSRPEEGRIGALGIASSFQSVSGLVMDLGGGSTQLTWMVFENGSLTISPRGAISFPYGAAAMTHLLSQIDEQKHTIENRAELKATIKKQYKQALDDLKLPEALQEKVRSQDLTLYLSGGGFRGWGYILMSRARRGPYPIPVINGYQATTRDFKDIATVKKIIEQEDSVFRISKRRAMQVPAVAFLVDAIAEAYPFIGDIRFCQGGVREGYLFDNLPTSLKSESPLVSATAICAVDTTSSSHLTSLIQAALPSNGFAYDRSHPATVTLSLVQALANTMYMHSSAPKESASLSALYLPITGVLASAHGISHTDRSLLALSLCQRWDGELPPPHDDFRNRLRLILTPQEAWWAEYLGSVAGLIGTVYPSGRVMEVTKNRIKLCSRWADGLGKKGAQQGIVVEVQVFNGSEIIGRDVLGERIARIEDLGKKKNRVGGRDYGFGVPVRMDIEWVN